jgi:hypothetical protein
MKACQHLQRVAFLPVVSILIVDGILSLTGSSLAQAAGETLRGMLAAQIRTQGVACGKPLSAMRDAKRSKPDHDVWVLKCSNATYRISRFPDMAAKVERLR